MKKILAFLGLALSFNVFATDILLTWDKPTEREDGSQIEQIDRFNIYQTYNNVLQDVIEVPADILSFQISNVEAGNYTFQISTVEFDQEGNLSQPISVNVPEKILSLPKRMILTIEVIE